jgi:hypothetical protein
MINHAHFENNQAVLGGGLFALGELSCADSEFVGNSAGSGGGLYTVHSVFLTNTVFFSNVGSYSGGGIDLDNWFPEDPAGRIVNSLLIDNDAGEYGAGIIIAGASATRPVDILHTTIADRQENSGQAIAIFNGVVGITDTIITSHTIGISRTNGIVYADYNLFFGNGINTVGTMSGGSHDVSGDPRFVDIVNDDYHLGPDSAAIDEGVFAGVTIDLDGHSRLPDYGGLRVDIGAYEAEYQGVVYHTYLPVTFKNQ